MLLLRKPRQTLRFCLVILIALQIIAGGFYSSSLAAPTVQAALLNNVNTTGLVSSSTFPSWHTSTNTSDVRAIALQGDIIWLVTSGSRPRLMQWTVIAVSANSAATIRLGKPTLAPILPYLTRW